MKDGGWIKCTQDIYQNQGLKGFYQGFSACGTRAVIANAFTFLVYEKAKKFLM